MKSARKGLVPALFGITLAYFSLGFISLYFALIAVACMGIPFFLIARYKKKVWCQHWCPRASLTTLLGKKQSKWKSHPKYFTDGYLRKVMLWYFGLNLLFIAGSTIQVALGNMDPMSYIRLFIAIPLWPLPQLFPVTSPPWLIHITYRLYSMMLSTTLLSLVMARTWRSRTWCAVCPVGTLSNKLTHLQNKSTGQA